jgi:hypothetical protein
LIIPLDKCNTKNKKTNQVQQWTLNPDLILMERLRGQGGPGRGQGRKPKDPLLKREPFPLRLSKWLIDWIDKQPGSRADIIEAALIKLHHLKPPKETKEE